MAISETEQQQLAQLNQDRLKKNQKSKGIIQGATPATFINIGEMIIILGAALTVDIIDLLDLTGIGAIVVRFIDIPTLGALWLWRILKHQAGPKKDPTFLILTAFLVEISPVGMIPTWTLFVAYVYFQDSKLGQKTIGKLQKLAKIKKPTKK
jgi:hypothetical protein